ncbi:hypothetical protein WDU94_010369 [Cyamophila willieti]
MPTLDHSSRLDENKESNIEASIPNIRINEVEDKDKNGQAKDNLCPELKVTTHNHTDKNSYVRANDTNVNVKNANVELLEVKASNIETSDEELDTDQAFRDIVENATVEVIPPATGHTAHPGAFADYCHAKLNKTKIIHFPSWDSPNQSPEFKLYIAKCELIKVTHELSQTRQKDPYQLDNKLQTKERINKP